LFHPQREAEDGKTWLVEHLEREELHSTTERQLEVPLKSDGRRFELDDLLEDQRQIMTVILCKLREWLSHLDIEDDCEIGHFKPLRMTVMGAAGTGKSVLINTLVTVLRIMFDDNDVVRVAAPTGTAAFNVGGETLHRMFSIMVEDDMKNLKGMSERSKKAMLIKFKKAIAILIDERSMVGMRMLGSACLNVNECAHGGNHSEEDWGGVPIVILVGDDFQLPPPFDKGAFDVLHYGSCNNGFSGIEALGAEQFINCSNLVMELSAAKRQRKDQQEFKGILSKARVSEIDNDTASQLVNELSLQKNRAYTDEEKTEIFQDSLFISANKAPVAEFNLMRLSQVCSKDCPVAVLKSKTMKQATNGSCHLKDDSAPNSSILCKGSLVSICGRNFEPKWGLHNGALAIVVEIVFAKGESPLHGDLPLYVVIDLKTYCGPVWDKENPTVSQRNLNNTASNTA